MKTWWTPQLHAVFGGIVVAIGVFVMWEQAATTWALLVATASTAFLWWQGRSIAAVWAWTTLGLGIESMTWPIVTMIRMRMGGWESARRRGSDLDQGPVGTGVLAG